MVRDELFKTNLSVLYQGRSFRNSTLELLCETGKNMNQRTREEDGFCFLRSYFSCYFSVFYAFDLI